MVNTEATGQLTQFNKVNTEPTGQLTQFNRDTEPALANLQFNKVNTEFTAPFNLNFNKQPVNLHSLTG
jgi:hypothetical protein